MSAEKETWLERKIAEEKRFFSFLSFITAFCPSLSLSLLLVDVAIPCYFSLWMKCCALFKISKAMSHYRSKNVQHLYIVRLWHGERGMVCVCVCVHGVSIEQWPPLRWLDPQCLLCSESFVARAGPGSVFCQDLPSLGREEIKFSWGVRRCQLNTPKHTHTESNSYRRHKKWSSELHGTWLRTFSHTPSIKRKMDISNE